MKTLIHLAIVLSSVVAVAGPEEHKQAQKCYFLSADQVRTSEKVPVEICLEDVALNIFDSTVSIYSYFYPEMYKNLQTDSVIRQTEDSYRFRTSSILFESIPSGCDQDESVKLVIVGDSDIVGQVDNEALKISVEHRTSGNTCHSQGSIKTYKYSL